MKNLKLTISFNTVEELQEFLTSWKTRTSEVETVVKFERNERLDIEPEILEMRERPPLREYKTYYGKDGKQPFVPVKNSKPSNKSNRWTKDEDEFLRANIVKEGLSFCAEELGRTRNSVSTHCVGLRKKDKTFPRIISEFNYKKQNEPSIKSAHTHTISDLRLREKYTSNGMVRANLDNFERS
jgi:hypothetical protein